MQKAPTFVGASEIESELGNLANDQTNPEGRARLTRRLIMDLVFIVIFEIEYSTVLLSNIVRDYASDGTEKLVTCGFVFRNTR